MFYFWVFVSYHQFFPWKKYCFEKYWETGLCTRPCLLVRLPLNWPWLWNTLEDKSSGLKDYQYTFSKRWCLESYLPSFFLNHLKLLVISQLIINASLKGESSQAQDGAAVCPLQHELKGWLWNKWVVPPPPAFPFLKMALQEQGGDGNVDTDSLLNSRQFRSLQH